MTGPDPPRPAEPHPRHRRPDLAALYSALQATAVEQVKAVTNSAGQHFVLVPAGSFVMGSAADEPGHRTNEEPAREVVLTRPVYLAVHPVTQAVYKAVTGKNPAAFHAGAGGGPDHPVESVAWHDAVAFCDTLGRRPDEVKAGRVYRLPTEAEWEYACRAGAATPFSFGPTLAPDHAVFGGEKTAPVGRYPPNLYGLSDLHGNVWEWCADWYGEGYYRAAPDRDPAGPAAGAAKILRGGSWQNQPARCRAAYRNALPPHQRDSATGFRVVLELTGRG